MVRKPSVNIKMIRDTNNDFDSDFFKYLNTAIKLTRKIIIGKIQIQILINLAGIKSKNGGNNRYEGVSNNLTM